WYAVGGHARRRRHEFRADWLRDEFLQDAVDLGLCGRVEGPAHDLVHRLDLRRVARSPQRDARAMVENPAHGEMDHAPAIALPSEIVEIPYRREVLGIARSYTEAARRGAARRGETARSVGPRNCSPR